MSRVTRLEIIINWYIRGIVGVNEIRRNRLRCLGISWHVLKREKIEAVK